MRILILANDAEGLYKFRDLLIQRFIEEGIDVFSSLPFDDYIEELKALGCKLIETNFKRHGINPVTNTKLIIDYIKMINRIKPDVVVTYTIKPNIYGGIACGIKRVPQIANITGLGTAFQNDNILKRILVHMYRFALMNTKNVFFQNSECEFIFRNEKIALGRHKMIPGSGVNLSKYSVEKYPRSHNIEFVFIGRIMKDKGIDEYLRCAEYIGRKYSETRFHVCGPCEPEYKKNMDKILNSLFIIYHGNVSDTRDILSKVNCIIHPSYHEGMSNVLLEASACGRPCLCSDIPGCREIVDDGETGFYFKPKNSESLIEAVEKFIALSYEQKKQMGLNARKKVEKEFDRNIVVNAYMEEINKIMEKNNAKSV